MCFTCQLMTLNCHCCLSIPVMDWKCAWLPPLSSKQKHVGKENSLIQIFRITFVSKQICVFVSRVVMLITEAATYRKYAVMKNTLWRFRWRSTKEIWLISWHVLRQAFLLSDPVTDSPRDLWNDDGKAGITKDISYAGLIVALLPLWTDFKITRQLSGGKLYVRPLILLSPSMPILNPARK